MKDPKQILKNIIENDGCCNWVFKYPNACDNCPIGKLKQKRNGDYYSCVEALGAIELTAEEANRRYRSVAERLFIDIEIEDLLSDD